MLLMMTVSYMTNKNEGALWIIVSIIVGFVGAGIQQSGFSFHKDFNNNDIYHVVQMLGMYLLYYGVMAL